MRPRLRTSRPLADADEVSDLGFAACCLLALLICMGCCVN